MRLLLAALVLATATPARAQFFTVLDDLVDNVNAIVFYGQMGRLVSEDDIQGTAEGSLYGGGAEVLINLPGTDGTAFELALGTNVVQGFRATEPSLDLRTSLRSLPTISVYASQLGLPETSPIMPYVGANFGVLTLWNARGYLSDGTTVPVSGETFELGAAVGAYVNTGPLSGLYVEASYRHREFESLTWDAPQLPAGWPRSLNASGGFVSVGWQFYLTREEKKEDE